MEPGVETSSPIENFIALLYSVAVQETSDGLNAVPKIKRHTNIIASVLLHVQFCVTNQSHLQPYDFFYGDTCQYNNIKKKQATDIRKNEEAENIYQYRNIKNKVRTSTTIET